MRASTPFHVLAKPFGARCNLECEYCFYLGKREMLAAPGARMDARTLETFVRTYIESQPAGASEIEFAWQGGEPTLAGLDFFRLALEFQERYRRPGMTVRNALQTNGTLLDGEWIEFLRAERFLVGLSLDGPREMHDAYRVDAQRRGSFERALRALALLRDGGVEFNVLTVVQRANSAHPRRVYDFLVDHGVRHLQFIPLVEFDSAGEPSERSVEPLAYGDFLNGVLERWLALRHVGAVFVRDFEALLASVLGRPGASCVTSRECGRCLAIERTGDVFACDHFVDWPHHLGNVGANSLAEMVESGAQRSFARDKSAELPEECASCEHLRMCWGGCPKDRLGPTASGERGSNYLCAGYRRFFRRATPVMRQMARCLEAGRPAADWNRWSAADRSGAARNAACPCGSGRKSKHCCGT